LTFSDGVRETFTVTPLQAIIIALFNDESKSGLVVTKSVDSVANRLKITEDMAKQALYFWTNCGVLREKPSGVFHSQTSLTKQNVPQVQDANWVPTN